MRCPRYLAQSDQELAQIAKLWYRIGWRDKVVPGDEMRCTGCTPHKACTYQLVACIRDHQVEKCAQCGAFPCEKIQTMLARTRTDRGKAKKLCPPAQWTALDAAFFHKEENLLK